MCVPEVGVAEGVRVVYFLFQAGLLVIDMASIFTIQPQTRDTIGVIWLYSVKLVNMFAEGLEIVKLSFAAPPFALIDSVGW